MARKSSADDTRLDNYDLAILNILQRNNATSQRAIAKAINLSAPAVQRRIKRMEKNGTILANVAVVDPERVGYPITIIVEVELENERADLYDAAQKRFTAAPEVQQCYDVTGESDFILVILVRSMSEYTALSRRLFFGNRNVREFRTLVVTDRAKVGLAAPPGPLRASAT
ncbi:MAG TPA: Lrp/AsnC family transcriptional regulator [Gemmatimonadaceae bacterium]|jgi:Lrp/AsnC family leucine-responsive transcriptional regulator|nr:Lrp/AsnC family transcriptional regulator [Gemmatimonadaceae bacterium]